MNKILITGNSGYIGSHLTKMLAGYELHGLDKNQPMLPLINHHTYDIRNAEWILNQEYDCVVHLAAEVSVNESVQDPINYYHTNTLGTLNVLKNIKTKNFIFASTGAADVLNSPYGISKRMAEDIVNQYCRTNDIPFTIFRFYNVVGSDGISPTNPDGLMWNLIAAKDRGYFNLFGTDYSTTDGTCVRDYVHVNEICKAIIEAICSPTNAIENLGHGIGTTVQEMINIFKKVNNCNFDVINKPRRSGDLEYSVLANPSKLMKKLYTIEQLLKL